jgi:3-hydroxyacyl-CoA dehydrogenase
MKNFLKFSMSSFAKPQVGFVGTGNMGGPMAKNLAAKGYQVFAFDAVMQFLKKYICSCIF